MKILTKEQASNIIRNFADNDKLFFKNTIDFEPDTKIYTFVDKRGHEFWLVCRDFCQDYFDVEDRVFQAELKKHIAKHYKTIGKPDYWLQSTDFDNFPYYFSFVQVKDVL